MASVAVCVPRSQAGQQRRGHGGHGGVHVHGGQHPIPLAQQTVKNQQRQGRIGGVRVNYDVPQRTQILQDKTYNKN